MSQSARDYLESEANRLADQAAAVVANAEKEGRGLDPEEQGKVQRLLNECESKRARVEEIDENEHMKASIERMRGTAKTTETVEEDAKSIGDAFLKSDAYKALRNSGMSGKWTTGPVELPSVHAATVTTAASPIVTPDFRPGVDSIPLRRLTVSDLLASGSTDSNQVTYVQEASETNAADAVTEGDAKPESTIVMALINEAVRKIATFLPVADEMLEDVAQLRSFLDNRLRLFVQHKEEQQLINGNGTPPQLRGLLQRTGILTQTRAQLGTTAGNGAGASILGDVFYQAITSVRSTSLIEPDGIVVNPSNWAVMKMAKDDNLQYYGGGPFTGQYGNGGIIGESYWGLPVVVTGAMPANTALVGAFGTQAQIFRKGGLTVEASNSHSDFFQKNLTAIRAEERLALAVYRPNAFHAITALQTA